jgi:hypothetical protein
VKKRAKVHLLPTDKAENCIVKHSVSGNLYHHDQYFTQEYLKLKDWSSHHLYITTDDEIKEGDWYILKRNGFPLTIEIAMNEFEIGNLLGDEEKIIATTDTKLKLPQPSKDFIESYCKNPVDKVMVEYGRTMDGTPTYNSLALTSNNEIIIHLIEEKMYSKDEVVQLLMKSLDATVTKHDKFRALFETQLQEWINKKLN